MTAALPPSFNSACTPIAILIMWMAVLCVPARVLAQSGTIVGVVTDAQTDSPLPGASVRIEGTAIGAATDLNGAYRIDNVPTGSQTLVASYLGYESEEVDLTIPAGETVSRDFELSFGVIEGEEVVVTAQAEGQARAINQQLSSNTIVNVVSSDRIQELPDQNAAESIARLPGISVQRDAGEGQKIVVRGLAPRFNSVTINGERIPSTDPENRSVDLSMISPDVLAGIEVFKALTPDKDGDAIGGSVNLVLRQAPPGFQGTARLQTGYNSHENDYGQYKGSLSLSDRFLNDRLGALLTGSLQRANRGSDVFTADYEFRREGRGEEERGVIGIENVNLADRVETRDRYSAGLAVDYDLGQSGAIFLNSFFARTNRDEVRRRKRYRIGAFRTEYDLRARDRFINLFTSSLRGEHPIAGAMVDWQVSHSTSLQKQPYAHYARFQELGAYENGLVDDRGPELIPQFARNDLSSTWFQYATFNPERTSDRDLTAELNVQVPFTIGSSAAGYVQLGGKHRSKNRTNDPDELRTPFGEVSKIGQENTDDFELYRSEHIALTNFLNPDFSAEDFLEDEYEFGPGLDAGRLDQFWLKYGSHYGPNRFVELQDYTAGESISAGYLMAELHLGRRLMFLPGFRYEWTENDYNGLIGQLREDLGAQGELVDTTGGQQYGEFLPMVHARYKFTSWLDLRLAMTRTLSRPDYYNLVPFEEINDAELTIRRGNPLLKHTKAWNYDAFLSIYSNRLGLLTLGAFYKQLRDIDYLKLNFRVTEGEYSNYALTEPTNAEESTVYGFEFDLQTNLRFLPGPLDGILINANYSYAHSETLFPFFEIGPRSPDPPFRPTIIDTFRVGRMPGQADHIANVTVGYEKGGFSGRISMVYQGESLALVGTRPELDGFTNAFIRWDAAVSQRIGALEGTSVFVNLNNLSNQAEASFLGIAAYPTVQEFFGWSIDVGVRYEF